MVHRVGGPARMSAPLDVDAVSGALAQWLTEVMPGARGVEIRGLRRVAGGMSSENWLFDASWVEEGLSVVRPLVLRCTSANEIVSARRRDEFEILRFLSTHSLPVPQAHWLDDKGKWLGRAAFIMSRCPGRTERGLLSAGNALGLDAAARTRVASQIADALAGLHGVDVRHAGCFGPADGVPPAERELRQQQEVAEAAGLGLEPELVLAACWLKAHLPEPPDREVVVHGDFRPANILVDRGEVTAVLDWELAHRGDAAEDIGWYLAPLYAGEHFIENAWTRADFLARYRQKRGHDIDPEAVRFWEVFAMYKLCTIAMSAMRSIVAGDRERLMAPPHRLMQLLMRAVAQDGKEIAR
jgi:aminoglycoside phosphotransferase (APT) family kinase protein